MHSQSFSNSNAGHWMWLERIQQGKTNWWIDSGCEGGLDAKDCGNQQKWREKRCWWCRERRRNGKGNGNSGKQRKWNDKSGTGACEKKSVEPKKEAVDVVADDANVTDGAEKKDKVAAKRPRRTNEAANSLPLFDGLYCSAQTVSINRRRFGISKNATQTKFTSPLKKDDSNSNEKWIRFDWSKSGWKNFLELKFFFWMKLKWLNYININCEKK